MKILDVIAGAATLFGIALAADTAIAPPAADAARREYSAALARAGDAAAARWAFSLTYTNDSGDAPKSYRLRYDPRLPSGQRWRAVEPPAEQLSKGERKAFKRMSGNDDADDALVYDSLAEKIERTDLVSVNEQEAVFAVPVEDADLPEKVLAALSATARLDRKAGYVSAVEVVSKAPFKPAAVASRLLNNSGSDGF